MTKKKPDMVVFNEDDNRYDAAFKPFATGVGAPQIQMTNIAPWKRNSISALNKKVKAKFEELQEAYDDLLTNMEYNALIHQARFTFQPVIGSHYHLYKGQKEATFLSLIAPHECDWEYLGSFRLNSENIWEKI